MIKDADVSLEMEINYLRSYTKGDAQKVEDNYRWTQYRDPVIALQDMWTELERWFGNTAAITNVLIERLRKTARFQEGESDKLQSFADGCVDVDSQLDFLPGLRCFNYPTAIAPIIESLPLCIRSKWEKRVVHYTERYRDAYPGFYWVRASPVKKTTANFSQARNQTTRSRELEKIDRPLYKQTRESSSQTWRTETPKEGKPKRKSTISSISRKDTF